jgi:hypothetical protein
VRKSVRDEPAKPRQGWHTSGPLRELGPSLAELVRERERLPGETCRDSVTPGWSGLLDDWVALYAGEPVTPSRSEGRDPGP